MERLAHTHTDDRSELLSAYSDNVVDVLERRRAEDAIASCAACAFEVRELQLFKRVLHDLPMVQPPRSFTIDPATAPRPRWLLFPTLRLASALAAVLLFITLGVDTMMPASNSGGTTMATAAEAPNARSAQQIPQAELYTTASAAAAVPAASAESAVAADLAQPSGAAGGAVPEQSAPAIAAEAPPTAQDSAGAAGAAAASVPTLKAPETAGEDTESTAAMQATPAAPRSSFDTVVLLELVLAAVALVFGLGAFVAWRRGV